MKGLSSPRAATLLLAATGALVLVAAVSAGPSPMVRVARADAACVPTSREELFKYLQSGAYKSFSHESKPHPSQGPHGTVLTYLNPTLDGSLKANNAAHPVGAAAVKELHGGNNQLTGWSVSVKTQEESDEGNGWYWYEVFSTKDGSRATAGQGVVICTGCHSSGRDFVRISYPLQ